ncbi:hypothetical protein GCM10025876_30130 [Demequina litorisediminis]|uniref:Aminopeptidase N-like N-terminal domain-containing protein n=1 Tax=Demequina litorisediminis TaxID=1849022 RepID=A0ABQ6IJD3_9MICO|nr:hypothetical protein GCM10025876_30130 [Demequina litorisediminis]
MDPEDGEVYLYSQFEVADTRRMYAVFEQPDLKAAFTFTVTAPDHWHVLSNNPGTSTPVDGTIEIAGTERGKPALGLHRDGRSPATSRRS